MTAGGRHYGEKENLTLTDADLRRIGEPKRSGQWLRAFCPVHESDHQRSLSVNMETGYFKCHSCRCWGYMDWAREEYRRENGLDRDAGEGFTRPTRGRRAARKPPPPPPPVEPVRDDLDALMAGYREALPGSWGEKYLEHRGVPLNLAVEHGVGYASASAWPGRGWKGGRLVFGHHRPDGLLVNIYGRAVAKGEVPKQLKHDHLRGNKGWFGARVLAGGDGPLYVCEAALDALALIAAGCTRTVAIYGTHGWRWDWVSPGVREIVIAADADEGGEKTRELIGTGARLRGIRVAYLDADAYGGEKDAADAYAAGVLTVGEFPAPDGRAATGAGAKRREDLLAEASASIEAARREARVEGELDVPPGFAPESRRDGQRSPAREDGGGDGGLQRRAREALEKRGRAHARGTPFGGEHEGGGR